MPIQGPTLYQHWLAIHPSIRYWLPALEAAAAFGLLLNKWPRAAAISVVFMVSSFTGLLVAEAVKDYPKPCGCLGALAHPLRAVHRKNGANTSDWSQRGALIAGAGYLFIKARRLPVTKTNAQEHRL